MNNFCISAKLVKGISDVIVLSWYENKTEYFGEIIIDLTTNRIDTEYMSKDFVKCLLSQLVDDMDLMQQ